MKTFVRLTVAAAVLAFAGAAHAEKIIKLHHLNPDDPFDNPTGAMATVFKALVESSTNGAVKVQTYPGGQLGKDADVVKQIRRNIVQSGIFSSGGFAGTYPMIGVLDVPFAFPNISVTYDVFDGPFGQKLSADIEKKTELKVIGLTDSGGFFHFTDSKRPIKTPDDLKGLKIRTMGLETHKRLVSALGGQPVAVAWAEIYTALQTGVADGQMNPIPVIAFGKLNEVQKYLTLSGHLLTPYVWVISKEFYDGLTDQEKATVHMAAKSAVVAGRGVARAIEASDRGIAALAKTMEVYSPTPAERAKFREQALPPVRQFIESEYGAEGKEMLEAFLKAIEDAQKK